MSSAPSTPTTTPATTTTTTTPATTATTTTTPSLMQHAVEDSARLTNDTKEQARVHTQQLMNASLSGDESTVIRLISKGVDVNAVLPSIGQHMTCLMEASAIGHTMVVHALVEGGATVGTSDRHGMSAFLLACSHGHTAVVSYLLDQEGVDVNATKRSGRTSLCLAAEQGHTETVSFLLERGARVEQVGGEGFTALMLAAQRGHIDTVEVLTACEGTDLNVVTPEGRTALMLAAENGRVLTVRTLLDMGADMHLRDSDDMTALGLAASVGDVNTVKMLMSRGALTLAEEDSKRPNELMVVSMYGWYAAVRCLLHAALDIFGVAGAAEYVNKIDASGRSALRYAIANMHMQIAGLLLLHGADAEPRVCRGCPLQDAIDGCDDFLGVAYCQLLERKIQQRTQQQHPQQQGALLAEGVSGAVLLGEGVPQWVSLMSDARRLRCERAFTARQTRREAYFLALLPYMATDLARIVCVYALPYDLDLYSY